MKATKAKAKAVGKRPQAASGRTAFGRKLEESVLQAIDIVEGRAATGSFRVSEIARPPAVNVKATRTRLGLSQNQFAARLGIKPATLQNWEQGRCQPQGPARVLLAVIDKYPEIVEEVLA